MNDLDAFGQRRGPRAPRGHGAWRRGLLVLSLAGLGVACSRPSPALDAGPEPGEQPPRRSQAVEPREPEADRIEHTLRFEHAAEHYVEVESIFPSPQEEVELSMAVWTPGSYLIREYARHLEGLRASTIGGEPLPMRRSRKNRWIVEAGAAERIVLRYRVYARELSVRTNFVDSEIAILVGAATFLVPAGGAAIEADLKLEPLASWPQIVTALSPHPSGDAHRFIATSYDALLDSPIVLGSPEIQEFERGGVPHRLATFGAGALWDGERAAADLGRIVEAQQEFWGSVPYPSYVFLNVLLGGGGGLEHLESTLLMDSRWVQRDEEDYRRWLGLVSHEFFHTWNVKRLRPVELFPFDYENEVHTESLWIAEGITSYYDDLLLLRAGLIDREKYLELLSKQIDRVQRTPGRLVQPLSEASYDAWIKFYRPDENSQNTRISYYSKGALVAFLLDAAIREATNDAKSLDDAMRLAFERYSGERGYRHEEFRALCAEVAGIPLGAFFEAAVDGVAELEFAPALAHYGLRFAAAEPADDPPAYLGVETAVEDHRLRITSILRGSPAAAAGLNVGDELLAFGDERVPPGGLEARLALYAPGEAQTVLVARRGRLLRLELTFAQAPESAFSLERDPLASPVQGAHLDAWLGPVDR